MAKNKDTKPSEGKKLGRPVKAFGRRIQTTIYADSKLLDLIDQETGAGKEFDSRSEFYHQAAAEKLQAMGLLPKDEGGNQ